MYSVNARVFLVCISRSHCLKRLAQSRTLEKVRPKFTTCSISRSKKQTSSNLFTPVDVKPCKDEKIGEELTGKLEKQDILKVVNAFCRSPEVKVLAADNGLDEHLCQKGFFSFRKYCLESTSLPADLHIIMSDIIKKVGNTLDIFPYFLRHVREMFPHLECMDDLKKIGDIQQPANWYPEARALKRKFYFHCGPTNSGKTYHALQCFYKSKAGIYCAPLKLLAVEVHQKANAKGTACDLFTGEEVIHVQPSGDHSNHLSCTIEMCPFDKSFDVAVIDEIQMLKDPQRGWAWTRALLGLRAEEIHICGEEAAMDVVDSILCTTNEEFEVKKYKRLTKLTIDEPIETLSNVKPGDCIVCFNKNDIYSVASSLESQGHKVAIVYGSLPPHTKLAQCEKFNDPKDPCNVLVATDAVGMGLNLNIRRMIFFSLNKFVINESWEPEKTIISVSQALQIAGRAGRYGTNYSEGYVTTLRKKDLETLKHLLSQKPEPIKFAGLLPTIDQVELFSYYLPKSTLSELIDILVNLSTVDNSLYFMCDLRDFKALAQLIDHIALPLKVKFVFCCAPVNKKLHFLCVMFVKFAKMYSSNRTVTVKWLCNKIGWPLEKPQSFQQLVLLETYHEVLELYLWLSNRFEEYFPDGPIIREIQKEMDSLIQEGVVNLTKLHADSEKEIGTEGKNSEREEVRESQKVSDIKKSPSCDEGQTGGEENAPTADEIQEAVAEELRSPDRLISQGQQSAGSRGAPASYTSAQSRSYQAAGAQSRVSYHPSASSRPPTAPSTAPHSRIPSLRVASTCEEEPPRQSSPPVTPAAYGSRAASLGNTRAASPYSPGERSVTSYLQIAQNSERSKEYCADEGGPPEPEGFQYTRDPSQPAMRGSHPSARGTSAPSHLSMRGDPTSGHPSMRGTPAASHPSMRGASAQSQPAMRGTQEYSHPSMREMAGASQAAVGQAASGNPSMREGVQSCRGTPIGSAAAAMGSGAGQSAVTFGKQPSAANAQADSPYISINDFSIRPEPPSRMRQDVSGVWIPGIGLSTSGLAGMGIDAATSAMSYNRPNEGSGALGSCIPGCRTFMRDIQNAPASTAYNMTSDGLHNVAQFGQGQHSPGGSGGAYHIMLQESKYQTLRTPNFNLGAAPPGRQANARTPSPADGEHHHHHHHDEGREGLPQRDERVVKALGHLSQFKKTPSYSRCGVGGDLDFLKVCDATVKEDGRPGKAATFPEIPCLRQEDIDELIKCETADVEFAWFLTSDERKTYKKPCPKQQKAQMTVKALMQAHVAKTCGKEYSPLEHPDPEDISPELAAAMMFSQERGIKMEECPHYTITSLFPDEPKSPFPEKIPASSISIVDRNSRDQDEMIEKSASVPSEGVSDSAYTRTMKEKGPEDMGAQKSFDVDFAIGQSKRQYVLVAQKPQRVNKVQYRGNLPPWFPGYFSAFPDEDGFKVQSSPADLFYKAWIHSNPGNMSTGDVIVLD